MTGFRLLAHELAVLDGEPEPEPGTEPEPEPGPAATTAIAPIDDRDVAYTVRLIDAALIRIDAAVELASAELSFRELIALRDRALDR